VSEPSNVVNMKVQGRLIREAREARAKRKAEREQISDDQIEYAHELAEARRSEWEVPRFPDLIDDMEI
jgi:lipoate-protein ligase A